MDIGKLKKLTWGKIKFKLRVKLVKSLRGTKLYPYLYKSYWHLIIFGKQNKNIIPSICFYTARPNPGAGIGHQMANWIAGYWYAKEFQLSFAHWEFTGGNWDKFLGFGINEKKVSELLNEGYKIRRLPLFDNENDKQICHQIISSYKTGRYVFLAEQDQFLRDLPLVREDLIKKFYSNPYRLSEQLEYDNQNTNIAIHVRRGDILLDPSNPNLSMRFLSNDYFEKVLNQTISHFKKLTSKPIHIWFFSQGKVSDYPEFLQFENIHWCFDMSAQDSFLHMVMADIIITSKSSFSYKPALINKGIKICPKDFWHGYPSEDQSWIMADNNGMILWDK